MKELRKQQEVRLTGDAIYNAHELAYEGNFLQYMSTFPDLCVVVGDNEMIDELNTDVKLKDADFLLSMPRHQGGQSRGQHGWVHGHHK